MTSPRKKKRILVIADFVPYPVSGGNRARLDSVARAMRALGYQVDLLLLSYCEDEPALRAAWDGHVHIVTIPRHQSLLFRIALRLRRLAMMRSARVLTSHHLLSGRLLRALAKQVPLGDYAAVWVNYFYLSKIFDVVPKGVLKVLDTHDKFAGRVAALARDGVADAWFTTSTAVERACLERADLVVAIQREESAYFRSLTSRPVVELGHMAPSTPRSPRNARSRSALFVGGVFSGNLVGVAWFCERVVPLILERCPEFRLTVVGLSSEGLADRPWLDRVGLTSDLAPHYAHAGVALNPTPAGTGLSI